MTEAERSSLRQVEETLAALLRGETPRHDTESEPENEDLRRLSATTRRLAATLGEATHFIEGLSRGELETQIPVRNFLLSPFKELHANLRHLVWQTKQVARGDLNQSVDFLGDFSEAFNALIVALREKNSAEEHLRYLSVHDPLTGLYNRAYFIEEMARLERSRQFPVTILVGDLDGLKETNDTHGHMAGDRLICEAAAALQHAVRGGDVVARVGGDEFVVFLPATDEERGAHVLDRIRTCLADRNINTEIPVAMSLGMATAHDAETLLEAYRLADRRMYEDKTARKHRAEDFW